MTVNLFRIFNLIVQFIITIIPRHYEVFFGGSWTLYKMLIVFRNSCRNQSAMSNPPTHAGPMAKDIPDLYTDPKTQNPVSLPLLTKLLLSLRRLLLPLLTTTTTTAATAATTAAKTAKTTTTAATAPPPPPPPHHYHHKQRS